MSPISFSKTTLKFDPSSRENIAETDDIVPNAEPPKTPKAQNQMNRLEPAARRLPRLEPDVFVIKAALKFDPSSRESADEMDPNPKTPNKGQSQLITRL